MERRNLRVSGILAIFILIGVFSVPLASAYWRAEPGEKLNRRVILDTLGNYTPYATVSGSGTTHTNYRDQLRASRQQRILEEIRHRRYTYKGQKYEYTTEELREQQGRYEGVRQPASKPSPRSRSALGRYRGGAVIEPFNPSDPCARLSGSRLANCRYEEQKKGSEMGS